MWALQDVTATDELIPSQYAKDILAAGLDIITWTFERSDLREGASKAGHRDLLRELYGPEVNRPERSRILQAHGKPRTRLLSLLWTIAEQSITVRGHHCFVAIDIHSAGCPGIAFD